MSENEFSQLIKASAAGVFDRYKDRMREEYRDDVSFRIMNYIKRADRSDQLSVVSPVSFGFSHGAGHLEVLKKMTLQEWQAAEKGEFEQYRAVDSSFNGMAKLFDLRLYPNEIKWRYPTSKGSVEDRIYLEEAAVKFSDNDISRLYKAIETKLGRYIAPSLQTAEVEKSGLKAVTTRVDQKGAGRMFIGELDESAPKALGSGGVPSRVPLAPAL
jgi:hypothetical protein